MYSYKTDVILSCIIIYSYIIMIFNFLITSLLFTFTSNFFCEALYFLDLMMVARCISNLLLRSVA